MPAPFSPFLPDASAQAARLTARDALKLRDILLLFALAMAVLLPGTIGVSLVDRDEGWYAQVCREMYESGDWLVPRYLGEVWLAKPPLLYWLVLGSFKLLGMGDWQARLVPVLCMATNVVLVGRLGGDLFGRRAGMWSGLIFATLGLTTTVGKMLLTDGVMLTCTLAAVGLHWRMARGGVTLPRAAGYWLFIGLGILAKGPATLLFAGSFGLGLVATTGWGRWVRQWRFWTPALLAVTLAAPWYIYIYLHAGDALAGQFLGYEILSRIANAPHGHSGPPGYYLLQSLSGLLPWVVFVPGALIIAWQSGRREAQSRLLLAWTLLPWVILELVRSKLPHYILPCYVPLAILVGRDVAALLALPRTWAAMEGGERLGLWLWPRIMIVFGLTVVLTAVWFWSWHWSPAGVTAGLALVAGFAFTAWLAQRDRLGQAFGACVGSILGFHLVAGLWLLPALEPLRLSRNLAEQVNALARPEEQVLFCGYDEPTVYFYLHNQGRPVSAEELAQRLAADTASLVVIAEEQWRQLPATAAYRLRPLEDVEGLNYVKMEHKRLHISRVEAGS